jgi:hypothetical protein
LNAGKISNKGVEISLSGSPLSASSKLKWEIGLNYARNRNLVEELAEGLDTYTLQERRGLISIAKVGQPYGTLFGIGFVHSPDGQVVYNNGFAGGR